MEFIKKNHFVSTLVKVILSVLSYCNEKKEGIWG